MREFIMLIGLLLFSCVLACYGAALINAGQGALGMCLLLIGVILFFLADILKIVFYG